MNSAAISRPEDFVELCQHIREAGVVAFDTEFVSESTYRPALGLLQFATEDECVAIDPLEIGDLTPWWEIMADHETTVIVHGGQAEIRFCLHAIGRPPQKLFDIQMAEGFRSRSYPLSYSAIVQRVLNERVDGSQTRTDWLRRPLSGDQLQYALEDVAHVREIWKRQLSWLKKHGRLKWAEAEFQRMIADIQADEETEPWERISGAHKLARRDLAVLKHLAAWRDEEAALRNRPLRRIIRDDLLIDLARRKPATARQALATRDLNRPEFKRHIDAIVRVIGEAGEIPNRDLPRKPPSRRQETTSDEQVIGKLLALSLSNRCAELDIAQSLVATNRDLNELVRYHRFGSMTSGDSRSNGSGVPRILQGWRAEVFGQLLIDVMDGRIGFRVAPAGSPTPLLFEIDKP